MAYRRAYSHYPLPKYYPFPLAGSQGGEQLTAEQWQWLRKLRDQGRTAFSPNDLQWLRPLRDSALIRAYPKGFLGSATAVEITTLGRLLVDTERKQA